MEHRIGTKETIRHISVNYNDRVFKVKMISNTTSGFIDIQIICEPTNQERVDITKYLENYIGE